MGGGSNGLRLCVVCGVVVQEDNTLLDAMLYAQKRLQDSILRSFGTDAEKLIVLE